MEFSLFTPVADASLPSLFLFSIPPSLPQQSLNGKGKKHIFSHKFPFYKNKEPSEQETSDAERKYTCAHGTVQDKAATNRRTKHLMLILQLPNIIKKDLYFTLDVFFYNENIT